MSEPIDPPAETSTSESFLEEYLETSSPAIEKSRSVRQGLPSTYRMRHDAHYVDELEERHHVSEPIPQPPSRVVSEAALAFPTSIPVTFALKDMSQELDGVASCFNLVESKARPLRERLGLRLARVGVQRGARAFHALRFLLEDPAPEPDNASLNAVVESALDYFSEELLLTETILRLRLHDAPIAIKADARLLSLAVQACAGMLIAFIEASGRGGVLQVSTGITGETVHCELYQDAYRTAPEQLARLTDLEWTDRPGGIPAGIGLAAAARIAQAHGGHLEARRKEPSGCAIRLILPAGALKTPPASRG